jgi:glycerol transport system permease protein
MKNASSKQLLGKTLKVIFYLLVLVVFLFPIYFMAITALKTRSEIETQTTLYPHEINMKNFHEMTKGPWKRAIINSIVVCVSSVALCLPVSFLAAYAFSRRPFMGDIHLYFWLITNRMAPAASFVLPFFAIYTNIGLFDTKLGLLFSYTLFNLPLAIWIWMSFMEAVPKEIDDAAFLDGFSVWRYFGRVFLPVMKPGLITVAVFIWMFSWTEMMFAVNLTAVASKTLPAQLTVTVMRLGYGVDWGMAAAGGTISIIPGIVLVILTKKYLTRGFVPLRRL